MTIYTAPLTIHCRCGFCVEKQEMEFIRKPFGDIVAEKHFPELPSQLVNGKKRSIWEIGTCAHDVRLHYLHCPNCELSLNYCPSCNTFNDFESINPEGLGILENQCCRICKRPINATPVEPHHKPKAQN